MTLILSSADFSFPARVVRAAIDAVRMALHRRVQRIALGDLLAMSPARLNDLGISRQDIVEAIAAQRTATSYLAERRAERAEASLARGAACAC